METKKMYPRHGDIFSDKCLYPINTLAANFLKLKTV